MGLIVSMYQIRQEKMKKKMGFGQTVEQKFAKKNDGFDGSSVSNLIEEREKKNGFWTNGGIEFAKKKMGFERTVEQNLPKK